GSYTAGSGGQKPRNASGARIVVGGDKVFRTQRGGENRHGQRESSRKSRDARRRDHRPAPRRRLDHGGAGGGRLVQPARQGDYRRRVARHSRAQSRRRERTHGDGAGVAAPSRSETRREFAQISVQ